MKHKKLLIINAFGTLGYLSVMMQWLWSLLPYLPSLLDSGAFKALLPTAQPTPAPVAIAAGPPSPLLIAVAVAVTIIVISLTIIVLVRLPVAVGKSGHTLTHRTAEYIVPAVTHSAQKLTPKKRLLLTARIVLYIKLALCLIPVVAALLCQRLQSPIPYEAVVLIAAIFAIWSLVVFTIQAVMARSWRIDRDKIW